MALSKCEFCGNAFNSLGTKVCTECLKQIDDAYIKVRKYIYQYPDKANFASIIEDLDIPEKTLSYLLNEGRINIGGRPPGSESRCKLCSAEISSGLLCNNCKQKVVSKSLKPEISKADNTKKENKDSRSSKDKDWVYLRNS